MLVDTPQITWHGGEAGKNAPILSIDTHPLCIERAGEGAQAGKGGSSFVLATAGTDAEVRLWIVSQPVEREEAQWEEPGVSGRLQSFVASLGGHERGVNVVRFSGDGLRLASASDGGTVVIWSVSDLGSWSTLSSDRDTQKTILRGATEDIYDLCWSPDGKYIACGSIDRRTHVWEVATKRSIATVEDHANYVQGTAWDPLSKYMATQSSDRSCRVYQLGQHGHGAAESASGGSGRPVVKCCNVIKSCVVTGDEQLLEETRGGAATKASLVGGVPSPRKEDTLVASGNPTRSSENYPVGSGAVAAVLLGRGPAEVEVFPRGRPSTTGDSFDEGAPHGEKGDDTCVTGAEAAKDKIKPTQRRNIFVDETVTSFFRRLTWTPDGAFLIIPTAQNWDATAKKTRFCTYLFTRGQFFKPAICLPGLNKPSVAVRCNPRLFTLKNGESTADETNEVPISDLPYRVVFAVVSLDAVIVYDTEHSHPLTVASGLHYSGLTDACWSADGLSLFVSSTDGYVSTFHFGPGELGVTIPEAGVPLQTRRLHPVIYGWRPGTSSEELRGIMPSSVPPSVGVVHAHATRETSTTGTAATGTFRGQREATPPNPDAISSKPRKKIVPTLLSPGLTASFGHPADVDLTSAPHSSVAIHPVPPRTDGTHGDRKKRRITSTLIHNGMEPTTTDDNGLTLRTISGETAASSTGGIGQEDKTPKKKRLAPTLVSAL